MAILVGLWDCKTCGHKGVRGPETHCVNCGAPRPQDVKFYLGESPEVVSNVEDIRKAKAGADWVCTHCYAHNKISEANCKSCGNARNSADGDFNLKTKDIRFDQKPLQQNIGSSNRLSTSKTTNKAGKTLLLILGGLFIFIILTLFSKNIDVTVAGFEWERKISYEKIEKVQEEKFELPDGAEIIETFEAIHHYDQIPDGTVTKTRSVKVQTGTESVKVGVRDMGNGYFEEIYEDRPIYEYQEETYEETNYKKVAVYQTKYRYFIDRWIEQEPLFTSAKDHNPYWHSMLPQINSDNKQRVSTKDEIYYVNLKESNEKIHTDKLEYNKWQSLKIGDILKAKKSRFFGYYKGLVTQD